MNLTYFYRVISVQYKIFNRIFFQNEVEELSERNTCIEDNDGM